MAAEYLLLENGSKLILEDGTGDLLLESSTGAFNAAWTIAANTAIQPGREVA